jgi:hypothetical protein
MFILYGTTVSFETLIEISKSLRSEISNRDISLQFFKCMSHGVLRNETVKDSAFSKTLADDCSVHWIFQFRDQTHNLFEACHTLLVALSGPKPAIRVLYKHGLFQNTMRILHGCQGGKNIWETEA